MKQIPTKDSTVIRKGHGPRLPIDLNECIRSPNSKIYCDDCGRQISKQVKMVDSSRLSIYCVPCFCKLSPLPSQYYVMAKLDFSLLQNDWTAQQELLLFQGLRNYGFGNWHRISDFISTKSAEAAEEHYGKCYLAHPNFIPSTSDVIEKRQGLTHVKERIRQPRRTQDKSDVKAVKPNVEGQIVGYMPLRGDFQVEYDNDAELLLAEMEFTDQDTEQQREIKKNLLDIYNLRVDERIRRKKFVIQRDLLDYKKQSQLDRKRTKEEKDMHALLKPFARYSSPEEHQRLIDGLIEEKKLRARIEELKQYRRLGFKSFNQVESFLEQRSVQSKKRNQAAAWQGRVQSQRSRPKLERGDRGLLTEQEERMCDSLQLSLYHYLIVKQTIACESVKDGIIKRDQVERVLRIDKKKVNRMFDYLLTIKSQDRK